MENIGYHNLIFGTYNHPLLNDLVKGIAYTGIILNAGVIGLSIFKIIKRDKSQDPLRGYIFPIFASIVGCVGYSLYFMKKNGDGFYPINLAYHGLVWLSAISVFGSVATELSNSRKSITIGHVAVYLGYCLLVANIICGIVFQMMPVNLTNILSGNYNLNDLDELRRYADLSNYIANANWIYLAVFLFLLLCYRTHLQLNGLLIGVIGYVFFGLVSLITDTATVYSDSRYASVTGIRAILVMNFVLVDVVGIIQMIMSIILCKKWVVGKPLPDAGHDMETARDNQTQMSNISNPFED